MTPAEYRNHAQPAIRRAFFRGENAAVAGLALDSNPYRRVYAGARARRGSWSETYALAFAKGWQHHHEIAARNRAELAPGTSAMEGASA